MPDSKPLLHCFSGSPFVWRVLIALEEKGIDYETRWLNRWTGEHRTPELLACNPRGRLPILQWGDFALYESLAICRFLELEHPEPALIPAASRERARTLVLTEESADLDRGSFEALMFALGVRKDEPQEARVSAYRKLHEELAHWEAHLQAGGDYFVGDALTLADVAVFPLVAFGVRTGLTLGKRTPTLAAWYARMIARPSVATTWPPHWRESEGVDAGYDDVA